MKHETPLIDFLGISDATSLPESTVTSRCGSSVVGLDPYRGRNENKKTMMVVPVFYCHLRASLVVLEEAGGRGRGG